jgi:hypothetical protein
MEQKKFNVLLRDFNKKKPTHYDVLPYFRREWEEKPYNWDKDYKEVPVKTKEELKKWWFPGYITNKGNITLFQSRYNPNYAEKEYSFVLKLYFFNHSISLPVFSTRPTILESWEISEFLITTS